MSTTEIKERQRLEEIVNSTTHGIGLMAAVIYTVILVLRAEILGNTWYIVTLLNKADHSFIYVLIAATCTPFLLFGIQGYFGWVLFAMGWLMALAGIIYKVWFYTKRFRLLSTWLYIMMASIILIAIVPLIKNSTEPVSLWFLLSGCISFLVGTI